MSSWVVSVAGGRPWTLVVVGVLAACGSARSAGAGSESADTSGTTTEITTGRPDLPTGCDDGCTECLSHDECPGDQYCDGVCTAADELDACIELPEFDVTVPDNVSAERTVDLVFTDASTEGVPVLVLLHEDLLEFTTATGASGQIAVLEDPGVAVQSADVDDDSDDDLIVATNESFVIVRQDEPEVWSADDDPTPVQGPVLDLLVADLDGDEDIDLVLRTVDELRVHEGNGDGTFALASTLAGSFSDVALTHGPGPQDAVLVGQGDAEVVLLSRDLTPQALEESSGASARAVRAADFNGDGVFDIVAVRGTIAGSLVAQWDGATLAQPAYRFVPAQTLTLEVIDVDGDGIDEMIAGDEMGVSIWQSGGDVQSPVRCHVHIPTDLEFPQPGGIVAVDRGEGGIVSIAYTDGGALTLLRTLEV